MSILKTESTAILTNTIKSQLPGATRGVLFPNQPSQTSAVTSVNNPSTLKLAEPQTSGGPTTISTQTNFSGGLY